jgi:peptidoglycan/LPS O-acetylase OafA/YrhL
MGVDVFFVLSGMLMSNILFVKRVPLGIFYKRRISRILPAFFIFISTISLLSWGFDLSKEHHNYLYNLFFIRTYWPESPDIWHAGIPIGHLWSLNAEEHCYILLSLITLFAAVAKRAYIPIFVMGFGSIFLHYLYVKVPSIASANYNLKTEIVGSFLMISAGYFLIKDKFEKYVPAWAPILSFMLAFMCYSEYAPYWSMQWIVSPFLLAFTVNHLNRTPELFKKLLSFPLLRLLGIWSFSIYLWQQPFYYYGVREGSPTPITGLMLMLLSIIVGLVSFHIIENPVRRYLNNQW